MSDLFRGVLVPALTPFGADLSPNAEAFAAHCRWLLDQGADGLAVFGTTSEANSIGIDERIGLLDYLIENGIPATSLMPGTGTTSLTDTVKLTRHAVSQGCGGVLMLPPFYYKGVSDDGLYRSYAEIIEHVGDSALRVYLYHIPPIAQIPLSLELIGRLLTDYSGTVVGIKDSSGDWSNTLAVLTEYPELATFCGSEIFLLDTLRHGGAGSITATANVNLSSIRKVFERWEEDDADALQEQITAVRKVLDGYPLIAGLKAVAADFYDADDWRILRPPLESISAQDSNALLDALRSLNFEMN